MTENKTKKQKAKEFLKNNKKKCISALLVVVSGFAYTFFDIDLNIDLIIDDISDKICLLIGGC